MGTELRSKRCASRERMSYHESIVRIKGIVNIQLANELGSKSGMLAISQHGQTR